MVYMCKGYCEGMEADTTGNNKRYEAGQKFCSICGLFYILIVQDVFAVVRLPGPNLETKERTSNASCCI